MRVKIENYTIMTMSTADRKALMDDMRSFDEPMPSVGIFWYDSEEHTLFGVHKKEMTPKMEEVWAPKRIVHTCFS